MAFHNRALQEGDWEKRNRASTAEMNHELMLLFSHVNLLITIPVLLSGVAILAAQGAMESATEHFYPDLGERWIVDTLLFVLMFTLKIWLAAFFLLYILRTRGIPVPGSAMLGWFVATHPPPLYPPEFPNGPWATPPTVEVAKLPVPADAAVGGRSPWSGRTAAATGGVSSGRQFWSRAGRGSRS